MEDTPKYPSLNKHNRVFLYFDDKMMKKITGVISDMIIGTGKNKNMSDGVRYLITEGLKNYEFYTRYNARVDFEKEQILNSASNDQD